MLHVSACKEDSDAIVMFCEKVVEAAEEEKKAAEEEDKDAEYDPTETLKEVGDTLERVQLSVEVLETFSESELARILSKAKDVWFRLIALSAPKPEEQTKATAIEMRFGWGRRGVDKVDVAHSHAAFGSLVRIHRQLRAEADLRQARLNPIVDKIQGITFKWSTASILAELSDFVYSMKDKTREQIEAECKKWIADDELRADPVYSDENDPSVDNAALVVVSSASIYLVFRGTVQGSKANRRQNLTCTRRDLPGDNNGLMGKVHKGFYNAQDSVWANLTKPGSLLAGALTLGSRDSWLQNFYIAGHSLGGAMAVITAARLVSENVVQQVDGEYTSVKRIDGVYTFGSPALFDPYAAEQYSEHPVLMGRTFRVEYNGDILVNSLAKLRFLHPGMSIRLRERDGMTVPARVRYDAFDGPRRIGPNIKLSVPKTSA
eukprot:g16014.t1